MNFAAGMNMTNGKSSMGHNGIDDVDESEKATNWFAVSRDIFAHEIVGIHDRAYTDFEAWLSLLAMASYETRKVRNKGALIILDPGDLMASITFLAGRWMWTPDKVRWFLKRLTLEAMITRAVTTSRDQKNAWGSLGAGLVQSAADTKQSTGHRTNQIQVLSITNYGLFHFYKGSQHQAKHHDEHQANTKPTPSQHRESNKVTNKQKKEDYSPLPPSGGADGGSDGNQDRDEATRSVASHPSEWVRPAPAEVEPEAEPEAAAEAAPAAARSAAAKPRPGRKFAKPSQSSLELAGEYADIEPEPSREEATAEQVAQAFALYNTAAAHFRFATCNATTDQRAKRLAKRLDDIGGFENFRIALRALGQINDPFVKFLRGKTAARPGEAPFRLDIDRLTQANGQLGDVLARLYDIGTAAQATSQEPEWKSWDRATWLAKVREHANGIWPAHLIGFWPGHPKAAVPYDVVTELAVDGAYDSHGILKKGREGPRLG